MKQSLLVKVKDIPEEGLELSIDQGEPRFRRALTRLQEGEAAEAGGTASFQVVLWPDRVDVHGAIKARLSQSCSRCANSFPQPIERDFLRMFLRSPQRRDEEDVELSSMDLDRDELVNDRLDLADLLEEELVLALPAKPLCMSDCKGICSGCGAELNDQNCRCDPEADPRWGALKGIKVDN